MNLHRILCLSLFATIVFAAGIADAGESSGKRHALLIGISKYHPDRFADLPGAEPDVVDLSLVLTKSGYEHDNVILMTNKAGATDPRRLPTASRIRKQLRRLAKITSRNDSIVLALAGHGVQPNGDEYFFCPQDADLKNPQSLISINEIYEAIDKSGAGFKLLLVDACREDTATGTGSASSSGGIRSVTRRKRKKTDILPEPPANTAAFFSCMPGQLAYERHSEHETNGVFFHAIVRGLQGAAASENGDVTLPGLERFVKKDVEAFVKKAYSASQHPVIRNNTSGLFPIVANSVSDRVVKTARELWWRGKVDDAVAVLDEYLRKQPNDPFAIAMKCAIVSEKIDERRDEAANKRAMRLASQAVELGPNEAITYAVRADVYRQTGKRSLAMADCARAIELDPNCAHAFMVRAHIHSDAENLQEMIRDIKTAVSLDDENPNLRAMHGGMLTFLNRLDEGIAEIERALLVAPDAPFLHYMKGHTYEWKQKLDKAIVAYDAGLRLAPTNMDLLCRRSMALSLAGDFHAAKRDLDIAKRINPKHIDVFYAGMTFYKVQGRMREAVNYVSQAIERDPEYADYYEMRAVLFKQLGRTREFQRDLRTFKAMRSRS